MLASFVPLTTSARPAAPGSARSPFGVARSRRRILCVFPKYAHSFGTFDHAFPLVDVKAFMPPQGLLTVAAAVPDGWEARFIDENVAPAGDEDYRWADAVFISGMHVQRPRVLEINRRAHALGKVTALGGPSVSACPDSYPTVDLLHIGELGDGTAALFRRLDESVERPADSLQERFTTVERLDLDRFPTPAYAQVRMRDYFIASVQFSSGCPFLCEFCDIPELYGRNPRLKSPTRVTAELDAMLARGNPGAVYFVDDNFVANPKAALALLHELVRWQKSRGYPVRFACEATLNLSKMTEALELMREAAFTTVFCGIETPEEGALAAMGKTQNLRRPILDSVRAMNGYGIEVVSGIILGLDTDTPRTGAAIGRFVEESRIPLLTINVLHALPRTPLWRRLEAAGRLRSAEAPGAGEGGGRGGGHVSNVEFLLPEETIVGMWRDAIARAYAPAAVYARFDHQLRETFPKRLRIPATRARLNAANVRRGLSILGRVLWRVGVKADYRREFWRRALPLLSTGRVEDLIHVAVVSHHVIEFARECARGEGEACFYSAEAAPATAQSPATLTPTEPRPSGSRVAGDVYQAVIQNAE